MDCQVVQGDFIRPESSLDFDPLHQPQTEINCGKIQTLAANSERFLLLGCGDRIVNHSREITDFNKDSDWPQTQPNHVNLPWYCYWAQQGRVSLRGTRLLGSFHSNSPPVHSLWNNRDHAPLADNLQTLINLHNLFRPGFTCDVNYYRIRVVLKPDFTIYGEVLKILKIEN